MAITILVYGESGTGKSTSIRTLDPKKTAIVNVIGKILPFPHAGYKAEEGKIGRIFKSDDHALIKNFISRVNRSKTIDTLIIDDFQYLMANEFMRKAFEKGYDKFTQLAFNVWDLMQFCNSEELRNDLKIYCLSHSETDHLGKIKAKTIGKLLDEKITFEGLFTMVLYSSRIDGQYKFTTQNTGMITAKSPIGMFDSEYIDNDLNFVNQRVNALYNLK
jgi:hypothetical protein